MLRLELFDLFSGAYAIAGLNQLCGVPGLARLSRLLRPSLYHLAHPLAMWAHIPAVREAARICSGHSAGIDGLLYLGGVDGRRELAATTLTFTSMGQVTLRKEILAHLGIKPDQPWTCRCSLLGGCSSALSRPPPAPFTTALVCWLVGPAIAPRLRSSTRPPPPVHVFSCWLQVAISPMA